MEDCLEVIPETLPRHQAHVAREHPRESSRYGTATHMQRAHASRGRRGGSRDRPRKLRLARRLVRAARALQPPSGSRVGLLRCSALYASKRLRTGKPQSADHRTLGGVNRTSRPVLRLTRASVRWPAATTAGGVAGRSISIDLPKPRRRPSQTSGGNSARPGGGSRRAAGSSRSSHNSRSRRQAACRHLDPRGGRCQASVGRACRASADGASTHCERREACWGWLSLRVT